MASFRVYKNHSKIRAAQLVFPAPLHETTVTRWSSTNAFPIAACFSQGSQPNTSRENPAGSFV
jgi:hypothetical protein